MSRRRRLGQHYLVDASVVRHMLMLAAIKPGERVLEIGTGKGALTRELVKVATRLEAYEVDRQSFLQLSTELGRIPSLELHNSDAFASSPRFDVLVTSLPYSESSEFVEWLAQHSYDRAVAVLQQDFAAKLTARPGPDAYKAVSVIAQVSSDVEVVGAIPRDSFDPPPRVNSSLVTMRFRATLTGAEIAFVKRLFSQKRRRIGAALRELKLDAHGVGSELDTRVNMLRPEEVINLARKIFPVRTDGE